MKSKILTLSLAGAVLLAAVLVLRAAWQQKGDAPIQDAKPAIGASESRSSPAPQAPKEPSPPAMPPASGAHADDLAAAEWVAQRSAGIEVNQTQQGKLYYPGSVIVKGVTFDLGETPPRFQHQLAAKKCSLLLGELDNRHAYQRHLRSVRLVDGKFVMDYGFSVSYPRVATPGGIAFHRSESVIQTVGIIIPEIKVPPGIDPSNPLWQVMVRTEEDLRYLDPDVLEKLKPQPLDSSLVVLMQTHPGKMPSSARILWLAFDDSGSLVVANR
jgi:hypothetical protein